MCVFCKQGKWLNLSCEQRALTKVQMECNKLFVNFPLAGIAFIRRKRRFAPSHLTGTPEQDQRCKASTLYHSQVCTGSCELVGGRLIDQGDLHLFTNTCEKKLKATKVQNQSLRAGATMASKWTFI